MIKLGLTERPGDSVISTDIEHPAKASVLSETSNHVQLVNATQRLVEIRPWRNGFTAVSAKTFVKGNVLGEYVGEKLTTVQKLKRYPNDDAAYLLGPVEVSSGETFYIDACDPAISSWSRYINCCREDDLPNVAFVQGPPSHEHSIYIVAMKDIRRHEELRVEYGNTYHWMEPRH